MSAAAWTKVLEQTCKSLKSENELNKRYTRSKVKFSRSPRFRFKSKM